jgi:hypothetical protein
MLSERAGYIFLSLILSTRKGKCYRNLDEFLDVGKIGGGCVLVKRENGQR